MPNTQAVDEMYRLRRATTWSPLSSMTRARNQHASRYLFADGSRIVVYANGDAAYDEGKGNGLQRWRNWHRLRT